eukprot:CAMPEP_0114566430 /NCGR_PEP_ID=MMETSP0114-20121206/14882_1 /TAXON_ID=31324 /ORGANISM="Goniomonas sp, Strain m" /LENGTH=62 /DNA_ID=CAMNT_0001752829 /DNA_START=255 /DNA_END=439 /DNA_ORIENTATION=+
MQDTSTPTGKATLQRLDQVLALTPCLVPVVPAMAGLAPPVADTARGLVEPTTGTQLSRLSSG